MEHIMMGFQGFKTKDEAKAFAKEHGGMLCYEKSDIEPKGYHASDYRDCVVYGGLSREYPYAVQWNIPSGADWPYYPKDRK